MPKPMNHRLMAIYESLLDRYGPQDWWPGDSPFEMMVGAVLTQAASWTNVEMAIANLKKADVLPPKAIRELDQEELAALVYPSGYYNAKARKLKALSVFIGDRFGDDLDRMASANMEALRAELLGVYGIGEETADDILLYPLGMPAFVIDTYAKRLLFRLGLAPEKGPYKLYRTLFAGSLP
jgi:endonuclease-3 related protein